MRSRLLWAGALGVLITACPSGLAGQGPDPDIAGLMKEIRRTQRSDFEAWRRFSFDRHVVRQRIDRNGEVAKTEILEFEVTALPGGFDEHLVRIDGRRPFASEVHEHRRAGRFAKHYGQVRARGEVDEQAGFSLAWLVEFPSYRLVATEKVRGINCYRLDFEPGMVGASETRPTRMPSRFLEAMAGSLWVARRSRHLVRAQARTVQPVRLPFGAVRILNLEVMLEADQVAEDTWLPQHISVASHLAILGRDVRKKNVFSYGRFREEH